MLDLEGLDAGRLDVIGLHPGDDAAAFVPQGPGVVEFGVVAACDVAAVAGEEWRLGDEGAGEEVDEGVVAGEGLGGVHEERRGVGQELGDAARLFEARADRGHVAGAVAVQREAGEGAVDVGDASQRLAKLVAEGGGFEEVVEGGLSRVDGGKVEGRGREAAFEEAGAASGDGAVDGGEERAFAAAGQGLGQFQVAAGCGVDLHRAAEGFFHGRAEERHPAALGQVEVVDEGAHRGDFGTVEGAEGVEGGDVEEVAEAFLGVGGVEAAAAEGGDGEAGVEGGGDLGFAGFGEEKLAGGDAGEVGAKAGEGGRHHPELAGGDVGPGEGGLVADLGEGGEEVVAAGFEERVLGQRAGGDKADDVAFDDRLGAALLRLGRVFQLFGDGDAEALADQGEKVTLGRVDRDAAHGDGFAQVEAPFGEGDVEGRRRRDGVVEEHLVEVAHPVEKKGAGVLGLDLQILRHHRRDGFFGHFGPPGGWARVAGDRGVGKGVSTRGARIGTKHINDLPAGVQDLLGISQGPRPQASPRCATCALDATVRNSGKDPLIYSLIQSSHSGT